MDVDEIPLDVCRLCIDAWKTSAEIPKMRAPKPDSQPRPPATTGCTGNTAHRAVKLMIIGKKEIFTTFCL